jgi:glutaredoxin
MGTQEEASAGLDEGIILFGRAGCKLCDAAEAKLKILGVEYRKVDLQECAKANLPEDWREINLAGAQACYEMTETLPWLRIAKGGTIVSYPEAMRLLRILTKREPDL